MTTPRHWSSALNTAFAAIWIGSLGECRQCLLVVLASVAITGQAFGADFRTWTDTTGKFSREAVFQRLDGGTVHLRLSKDGKVISVPLAKLSAADQAFARDAEEQASIKRAAYIKRQNDLALAILLSDREARQMHLLAQSLGFNCMLGMPRGEVMRLCDMGLEGFEAISIPMLRKYLGSAEHDDQTRKAFATVVSRQQKVVEELRAVKSLAETGNDDRSRKRFIDAKMEFEGEQDVPFESTQLCEVPRCFDRNAPSRHPAAFLLKEAEASAIVASKHFLQLACVTSLSPETAARLVAHKPPIIDLSGLLELPDQLAEVLSQAEGTDLYLDGLQHLSDSAARALANGKLSYVHLEHVRELSAEAFSSLLQIKEGVICGIETVPANAGDLLAKRCPPAFFCSRLPTIPDDVLEAIVSNADRLALGLKTLTKAQAAILARFKGSMLMLDSVESLDVEVAELLADCKGELSLAGVENITDKARTALDRHRGTVRIGGDVDRRDAFMQASDAYSLQAENPADAAVMVLVFGFLEATKAHLLAHSLAVASTTGMAGESLDETCNKAIAALVCDSSVRLERYLSRVEHDKQAQELFGQVLECRNNVRNELLAAKAIIESRTSPEAREALVAANQRYNAIVEKISDAITSGAIAAQARQKQSNDRVGNAGSPNKGVFGDDEWAAVVAGLQERGVVRNAGDANVYFGTFALLKSVFVQKKIPEPTAKQLFGLAKVLSVPIGQMDPAKMEATLRTMLQLAKETSTEVASRETLVGLGE